MRFVEAQFLFSIPFLACFDKFKAKYGNKIVTGKVFEKKEGKKLFQQQITENKIVYYSEQDELTSN